MSPIAHENSKKSRSQEGDILDLQSCQKSPLRRHSFSAPARVNLDRLDRATQRLGEKVLSLSRLISVSSSSPAKMTVRRCSACHMYIDGAPEPSLVHVGKYGPECTSAHHPDPCDHSGKDGACQYHSASNGKVEELSTVQLQARDQVRQAELDRMAAELVDIKGQNQVGMSQMSSDIQELKKMILGLRPPPPQGGSLASQPPPTISVAAPLPSLGGAVGGSPAPMMLRSTLRRTLFHPLLHRPGGIILDPQ